MKINFGVLSTILLVLGWILIILEAKSGNHTLWPLPFFALSIISNFIHFRSVDKRAKEQFEEWKRKFDELYTTGESHDSK